MNVIVTGATGFVGHHLVNELICRKENVTIIVRDEKKIPTDWRDKVHIVKSTVYDYARLSEELFTSREYDAFYHLAWDGTSGMERADEKIQLANVQGSIEAVKLAKRLNCQRFVNAGSIMEYEAIAYCNNADIIPGMGNIYSIAKLTADYMAKTVALNNNLEYINVIISNIYGAGEKSGRFLNTILCQMLRNERISLTEGWQLYDFIYVLDAVNAVLLAGKQGENNHAYYIGNEKPRPLREFVIEMKQVLDSTSELAFGEVEFRGVSLSYKEFDTSKLAKLGFVPQYTFEEGIQKTKEWILETGDEQ